MKTFIQALTASTVVPAGPPPLNIRSLASLSGWDTFGIHGFGDSVETGDTLGSVSCSTLLKYVGF